MGVVPFGPPHPRPLLSSSSLQHLWRRLRYHEHQFLSQLPEIWPRVDPKSRFTLGHAFDTLAFAANLKPSVLVAFGDGTDPVDRATSEAWVDLVWSKVKDELDPKVEAQRELQHFMQQSKLHTLGDVMGQSAVFTGHLLIYYPPASPAIRLVCDAPSMASSSDTLSLSEAIFANILGYPVTLPDETMPDRQQHAQTIVLGIVYRDVIAIGQDFMALKTSQDTRLCRQHWATYRQRLCVDAPILDEADLAISWDGRWEFAPDTDREALPSVAQGL